MLATLILDPDEELCLLAGVNLSNFCADPECQDAVIIQGAGKALVARLKSGGMDVVAVTLQALVHLVINQQAFTSLMKWDLVEALNNLVHDKTHAVALAVTFYNMSTFQALAVPLAEKGLIPSVLFLLGSAEDESVKIYCLAALQNLSEEEKTFMSFHGIGIVQALSEGLRLKHPKGAQHASAVLQNISRDEAICRDIYEDGGVLLLVQLCQTNNELTKYYCTATFYNLSIKHQLARENGFLDCLCDMATTKMPHRLLLCAKIFANISMHSKGRIAVGGKLTALKCLCVMLRSTCEDCDKIQYYSATALCNALSIFFKKPDVEAIVSLGIVNDTAVVMNLRVNEITTKEILAKALFNLLVREDTRELVDSQDVTQSLLRLMKLQVPSLSKISVQVSSLLPYPTRDSSSYWHDS